MIDPAKVSEARRIIAQGLALARRPAVMCSFGKDSMVVLHLVRAERPDLPVIFHREPFMPWKYAFANEVIQAWGLTVYDFPPGETAMQWNAATKEMEVQNAYNIGGGRSCLVPTGLCEPEPGEPYLCTLEDLLRKPVGGMVYPWDLVFHGHKSCDVDPLLGSVPLLVDIQRNEGHASAAFPLREWSDADVWSYTERNGLPIHASRYNRAAGWREHADKRHNPDYFPACTACLRPDGPDMVCCPKRAGALFPNVSADVKWTLPYRPSYVAATQRS